MHVSRTWFYHDVSEVINDLVDIVNTYISHYFCVCYSYTVIEKSGLDTEPLKNYQPFDLCRIYVSSIKATAEIHTQSDKI